MPYATTDDGVELFYEEEGEGETLVFVHESVSYTHLTLPTKRIV